MQRHTLATLIILSTLLFACTVKSTPRNTNQTTPMQTAALSNTEPNENESAQQQNQPEPASVNTQPTFTLNEIANHSTKSDCWLVIDDKVYDVTSFIPTHPGGNDILKGCGKDATAMFNRKDEHQDPQVQAELEKHYIGVFTR